MRYNGSAMAIEQTLILIKPDGAFRKLTGLTIDRLDATATVLGIFKKWDCEIGELTFHPGDTLALYTDGITESFNDADDQFGEDRLIDSLRRHCCLPSQALLHNIVADVRQFAPREQHDDITLIIAKSCPS